MTLKRLSLITFFIALTLSIELVCVNLPLTVKAQNNTLSQRGNSDSEQRTEQSQSSDQNGQVISGNASILSGNNILCEDQYDSNELSVLDDTCELSFRVGSGTPNELLINMFIDNPAGCRPSDGDFIGGIRTTPTVLIPHFKKYCHTYSI